MKLWQAAALVMVWSSLAFAQDPSPDELRTMYDDALAQLKAAQDRRSELAGENEKLTARIAQLEQELDTANARLRDVADRTFFLRSHYAAWRRFLDSHPDLRTRWELFIVPSESIPTESLADGIYDRDWPLSAER